MWQALSTWLAGLSVDDFNKVVLAVVALVALFLGPWMQWRIAKRQVQMQSETAKLQIETQSRIATRQIADNISTKRQNWIDELRKDAAEFLTVVGRIQELKRPRVEQLIAMTEIAGDFKERLAAEMRAKELVWCPRNNWRFDFLAVAAGEWTVCTGTPRVCNTGPQPTAGTYSMSIPRSRFPPAAASRCSCAKPPPSLPRRVRSTAARDSRRITPTPGSHSRPGHCSKGQVRDSRRVDLPRTSHLAPI